MQPRRVMEPSASNADTPPSPNAGRAPLGEAQRRLLEDSFLCYTPSSTEEEDTSARAAPTESQAAENMQRVLTAQYHSRIWSQEEGEMQVAGAEMLQATSRVECAKKMLTLYKALQYQLMLATKTNSKGIVSILQLIQRVEEKIKELVAGEPALPQHLTLAEHLILGSIFPECLATLREKYQEAVLSFLEHVQAETADAEPAQPHPAAPGCFSRMWQWLCRVMRGIVRYLCCCCGQCVKEEVAELPAPTAQNEETFRQKCTEFQAKWAEHRSCLRHLHDTGHLTSASAYALCALLTHYAEQNGPDHAKNIPEGCGDTVLEMEEMLCSSLKAISTEITAQNMEHYVTLLLCMKKHQSSLSLFMNLESVITLFLWVVYGLEQEACQHLRLMCHPNISPLPNTIQAVKTIVALTSLTSNTSEEEEENAYVQQCQRMMDIALSQNAEENEQTLRRGFLRNSERICTFFSLYTATKLSCGTMTTEQCQKLRQFQMLCHQMLSRWGGEDDAPNVVATMEERIMHPENAPPQTFTRREQEPEEEALMAFLGFVGCVMSPEGLLYQATTPTTPRTLTRFTAEWNREGFTKPCPIRETNGYRPFLDKLREQDPEKSDQTREEDPWLQGIEILRAQCLSPALQGLLPADAKIPVCTTFLRDACRSYYVVNGQRIRGRAHPIGNEQIPAVTVKIIEALLCALLEVGCTVEEAIVKLYDISASCHQGMAACAQTVLCDAPTIRCRDGTLLCSGGVRTKENPGPRDQVYEISIGPAGTCYVNCCYEVSLFAMRCYTPIGNGRYQQQQCMYGMDSSGEITPKHFPSLLCGMSFSIQGDGYIEMVDQQCVVNALPPGPEDTCYVLGEVPLEDICTDFLP